MSCRKRPATATCRYSRSPRLAKPGPARQVDRRRTRARGDPGDQAFLPGFALQLPGAERRAARRARAWPRTVGQISPACFSFCNMTLARLTRCRRPCSALCLYCWAISVAFSTRSSRKRQQRGEQAPQHQVHPQRRLQPELDQQRAAEHQEAQDEDGEHGGPVARVGEAVARARSARTSPAASGRRRTSAPSPQRGQRPLRPAASTLVWVSCLRHGGETPAPRRSRRVTSGQAQPPSSTRGDAVRAGRRDADPPRCQCASGVPAPHT